jgi:uncharacterized membrane protein
MEQEMPVRQIELSRTQTDISAPPQEQADRRSAAPRLGIVDIVRGLAIAGVVLFHLVWDLAFLNLIPAWIASHPLWLLFGRTLAGTFMALVGVSLVLASEGGLRKYSFLRRLGVLVLAAFAITLVTRIAFPQTFVYFGILHAIAVASVVGFLVLRLPTIVIAAFGVAVYLVGFSWTTPAFDSRWLAWTGFAASPPFSNDLVPVFPWIGLTLIGMAGTRLAVAHGWTERASAVYGRSGRSLAWLGRNSLVIYLLHQPILLGILIPFVWLVR